MKNIQHGEIYLRVLTIILKILAVATAIWMLLFGASMGIFGIGPAGGDVPPFWRFFGLLTMVEGVLYCLPNALVIRNRLRLRFYVLLTLVPSLAMLVGIVGVTLECGSNDLVENSAHYLLMFPFTVSAPASALCAFRYEKSKT